MLLSTPLRLAALLTLLAPAVLAQTAGEVLWTLDFPVVGPVYTGPDGTVYLITDRLHALEPDGSLKWTAPASPSHVDVGPDGTIYVGDVHTVYAYNPDGSERWRFTEDPGDRGWGLTTGPTLGPDGNLYAVTIQGGLGAFSLTPGGALRWNVPGFLTDDGREHGEVAFGPDNMYYADDGLWLVEGCTTSPYTGLVSITLDGDVDWCRSISGVYDPPVGVQATLDGRALIIQNALPGIHVQAYTPDGSRDWTQPFLPSNLGVGPDNHVYAWQGARLISMTADGDIRWSVVQPINNFPWRAVVAPDRRALVSGSVYGFGENGTVVAVDPDDGRSLWSLPVTGPSAGVAGPVAFSPDGSVVYVPVSTLSDAEPDQLWAIRVHDATPQLVTVAVQPVSPPITIGLGGGSFQFTVTLTNQTGEPQTFQAWTAATGPVSRVPVGGPLTVTLPPGQTLTRTLRQQVPGAAPAGAYTYHVHLGGFPGTVLASDAFPFTKAGSAVATRAAEATGGSVSGWSVSGVERWEEASASASSRAEGFALSEAHPNPATGTARLTLRVAEAQAVRAEVFDALGRRVALLLDGDLEAGAHALVLGGAALPAGVYVVRVTGETFVVTRRVTLLE